MLELTTVSTVLEAAHDSLYNSIFCRVKAVDYCLRKQIADGDSYGEEFEGFLFVRLVRRDIVGKTTACG